MDVENDALNLLREQINTETLIALMIKMRVKDYFKENPEATHIHLNLSAVVPRISYFMHQNTYLSEIILQTLVHANTVTDICLNLDTFDLDADRKGDN